MAAPRKDIERNLTPAETAELAQLRQRLIGSRQKAIAEQAATMGAWSAGTGTVISLVNAPLGAAWAAVNGALTALSSAIEQGNLDRAIERQRKHFRQHLAVQEDLAQARAIKALAPGASKQELEWLWGQGNDSFKGRQAVIRMLATHAELERKLVEQIRLQRKRKAEANRSSRAAKITAHKLREQAARCGEALRQAAKLASEAKRVEAEATTVAEMKAARKALAVAKVRMDRLKAEQSDLSGIDGTLVTTYGQIHKGSWVQG